MNLLEFVERFPQFKPILDVLRDHLMTDPENIEVYPLERLRDFGYEPRETTIACALQPNKLFFRWIPPSMHDFAHELIHLCVKPPDFPEEIYGYNLTNVVIFIAENDLKDVNPFELFQLSEDDVLDVLRKHGFSSIEDYYLVMGVIPYTHEFHPSGLRRDPRYSSKDIVMTFVTEIASGLPYFEVCRTLLRDLLEKTKRK